MRGLAGAFAIRINLIILQPLEHSLRQYNPPANIPHPEEIWMIYLDFAHTRHYLSTTKIPNGVPSIPLPNTRNANGNSARTRRATSSTELINDHTLQ